MFVVISRLLVLVGACQLLGVALPADARGDEEIAERLRWLGAELERDDQGEIIAVDLSWNSVARDSDLALLARLDRLAVLDISEMAVTSAGLRCLASMSGLKRLNLSNTKFTDSDFQYLEELASLEDLYLSGTAITDASIPRLQKLRSLEVADLSSTRVTPEGRRALRENMPHVHVYESWDYMATMVGGRGVLDTNGATFVFDGIRGPEGWSGGGGSSIVVSQPREEDAESSTSGGGGNGLVQGLGLGGGIRASASHVDGVPTIRVEAHQITIMNEGLEVAVNGQRFRLGSEKERIIIGKDGTARRDDWQVEGAP